MYIRSFIEETELRTKNLELYMQNKKLYQIFKNYIRGTPEKTIVKNKIFLIGFLTHAVIRGTYLNDDKIYINTRVLKHMYDKKPAEEFDCIINHLDIIVRYPDKIYKNKKPKRGHLCFLKNIKNDNYFCSLELDQDKLFIVTVFRVRKEKYLDDYMLLWSWEDDAPPS